MSATAGRDGRVAARSTVPRDRPSLAALVLGALSLVGGCAAPPSSPVGSATGVRASGANDEALYTDDVFALSAAAAGAYRESRWIDAARDYRRLTERVPSDAYAWFRLGNTYAQQGAYARAIHAYERSIERDGDQPKAWFNLSTAYLLHAQAAMLGARERLRAGDPARALMDERLAGLASLIHDRIEETVPAGGRP